MPPDPQATSTEAIAEQVFVALADPSRRAILADLAAGGPATATDLAARLPITRQGIAKHLATLKLAGLVTAEPGERRPPGANMPVEAECLVLRQHKHPPQIGIDAVGKRDVDDAVQPAERHRRLGAVAGQRPQAFALTSGE